MQASENYRSKGGILNRQKTNKQQQQNPALNFLSYVSGPSWVEISEWLCMTYSSEDNIGVVIAGTGYSPTWPLLQVWLGE